VGTVRNRPFSTDTSADITGGILTSVCTEFSTLDRRGHGANIDTSAMVPSWGLESFQWTDGVEYQKACLNFKHMTGDIAMARDHDSGRTYPDAQSRKPRIALFTLDL
jgi:hypothetical protein